MRFPALLVLLLLAVTGFAQSDPLAARHARILELQREEAHADVSELIGLQMEEAIGTTWQDSLYTYAYALGRAVWKSRDADAGIAATQHVIDVVVASDQDPLHHLDAKEALGSLLYDMGRMKDCARADSAAMAFGDALSGLPLIRRGKARQRLGLDYAQMGDHERSLAYYLQAKEVYGKSDTLLAMLMSDVHSGAGAAFWHLGELRKAEEQYRSALAFLEQSTSTKRHFRMAGTLTNIGILWQSNGDLARAKANYLEAIRRCGAVADTARDPLLREEAVLGRTRGYVNLATVYFALGDDGRSRELLELALRDREKILEPDDPKLLGVKERLADVELEAGNFSKAGEYVRAFLAACEKYYGTRSEDYTRACSKLGEVYAGLGLNESADSLFKRSIALSEAMENAPTDLELALAYRRHAVFYLKLHRYADAIAEMERALAIVRRVHGNAHVKVAQYELVMAEAAFANNDPATTLRLAQHALELVKEREVALRTSKLPQTWSQPNVLPDALFWKVKAERALGLKESAHWKDLMDLGIQAMERNKAAYDDEGSQLGFIGQQRVVYDLAIELAAEDHERSGSPADLDRFLALAESDRSILLKSRLNDFAGLRYGDVPDSIIALENRLVDALKLDPEDRAATADLADREKALAEFLDRLSREHPRYFNLRYGDAHVELKDVRGKLLTRDRDLLCYALTDKHLFMLVVGRDTAALVRATNAGVEEAVAALNTAIRERDRSRYEKSASALYQLVFAPVAHLLHKPELLIIPDGPLQTVNFECLLFAPAGKGKLSERMLIRNHAIAYLLSATTAVQFKDLSSDRQGSVLAFAPGFSDEVKQAYRSQVADTTMIDRGYLDHVRQPFAVNAAKELGELLSAQVKVGAEASEKRFRDEAKSHGVLHLGTHAEMNAASPLYSRLVLSKDGPGVDPDADGYLHAYEIYELDLRAQLAVLTACETGTGTADAEGVRSLGYGFAYAGCPSLVVSLWSIDEKTSSEIITRFYRNLADGMPKHIALRKAKLEHLEGNDDELALPYYWAGLVLVGDVEPVELGGSQWWWWLVAAVVLILAAVLFRRVGRR